MCSLKYSSCPWLYVCVDHSRLDLELSYDNPFSLKQALFSLKFWLSLENSYFSLLFAVMARLEIELMRNFRTSNVPLSQVLLGEDKQKLFFNKRLPLVYSRIFDKSIILVKMNVNWQAFKIIFSVTKDTYFLGIAVSA